jgi:hypothetical protein
MFQQITELGGGHGNNYCFFIKKNTQDSYTHLYTKAINNSGGPMRTVPS